MNPNLAEENLQTIRTLMERSALYRRALAPIMLVAGAFGALASAAGLAFHLQSSRSYATLWLATACVVITSAFVLARRQAINDHEPFWSPPTFRVAQALLPPLFSGMFLSGLLATLTNDSAMDFPMTLIWLLFYGCALHSAGFFMVRGIKWFGWAFVVAAAALMLLVIAGDWSVTPRLAHCVMGITFGGLHLAYGIYLRFTETRNAVA